jgi:hypothetical protein
MDEIKYSVTSSQPTYLLSRVTMTGLGFGAHLRFLFLCNSLPFFRVWCFARTVALAGNANLCYKTSPPAISEDILDSLVAEENYKIKEFFPSAREEEKDGIGFLGFWFFLRFSGFDAR